MHSNNRRFSNSNGGFSYPMCIAIAFCIMAITGCTADDINTVTNRGLDYQPIVDMKGVDVIEFQSDLSECKEYAAQIDAAGCAIAGVLIGAAAGAVSGAIIGNAFGNTSGGAQLGAAGGVLGGAGGGVVSAERAQERVVQRCLVGRGYTLLY